MKISQKKLKNLSNMKKKTCSFPVMLMVIDTYLKKHPNTTLYVQNARVHLNIRTIRIVIEELLKEKAACDQIISKGK